MKKVLVVDDTKNIRTLLTTCLEIEGYEVRTANDGKQALECFSRETYDLAFLDIKMPEISGTEVLRRIREQGVKIPVVIITAFATVKNAIDCTRMGAVAYVQKPFTAEKIRTVIKEIISCHYASNDFLRSSVDIRQIEELLERGHADEAVKALKKALSSEPTNACIYKLLGKAFEVLGDRENSEKFYKAHELFHVEKS